MGHEMLEGCVELRPQGDALGATRAPMMHDVCEESAKLRLPEGWKSESITLVHLRELRRKSF
eukprot:8374392-Pyramimonas_sp.AAC.1